MCGLGSCNGLQDRAINGVDYGSTIMDYSSNPYLLRMRVKTFSGQRGQLGLQTDEEGFHVSSSLRTPGYDPPHDRPEDQAVGLPKDVLTDIKKAARKVIMKIQPAGASEGSYTEVRQGVNEPFTSFIDRLTQAVERQCPNEVAQPHLIRSLASANANEEFKSVIHALPGAQPTLSQMIEACSKIHTSANVAAIQTNIMEEQFGKHQEAADQQDDSMGMMAVELAKRPCFKCRKFGHIKKFCPETVGNTKAQSLCSRCRKGKHFANQCRSKTNIDGRPLPHLGNSKKSAACQHATTQVVAMTQQCETSQDTQYAGNHRLTMQDHLPLPQQPRIAVPRAQFKFANSKLTYFMNENHAVISTGVTGTSWKRQEFLIIGKNRSNILGLIIYPTVIKANQNEELTVLAQALQAPLIIPENTPIAKAIALPPNAIDQQVMPICIRQRFDKAVKAIFMVETREGDVGTLEAEIFGLSELRGADPWAGSELASQSLLTAVGESLQLSASPELPVPPASRRDLGTVIDTPDGTSALSLGVSVVNTPAGSKGFLGRLTSDHLGLWARSLGQGGYKVSQKKAQITKQQVTYLGFEIILRQQKLGMDRKEVICQLNGECRPRVDYHGLNEVTLLPSTDIPDMLELPYDLESKAAKWSAMIDIANALFSITLAAEGFPLHLALISQKWKQRPTFCHGLIQTALKQGEPPEYLQNFDDIIVQGNTAEENLEKGKKIVQIILKASFAIKQSKVKGLSQKIQVFSNKMARGMSSDPNGYG
ncbi:hypothetical protein HGM15179_018555 [Zosterops borbonicus]|uniref:CCHC-type domain-containing protein n=1 Tax=Zosterops borbonicus TaxID=364589 RepID=A0A8K1DC86_9PASS|nr:hypothetical protein HGM15179_018555 [Zosterops borbonicus]